MEGKIKMGDMKEKEALTRNEYSMIYEKLMHLEATCEELYEKCRFNLKDKHKDINATTCLEFCKICHEKNIINFILSNNSHEEIIKRLYPILKVMYINNFGFDEENRLCYRGVPAPAGLCFESWEGNCSFC